MNYFFFFSHVTGDTLESKRHKKEFYQDLVRAVEKHVRYDKSADQVGFFDADMAPGVDWKPELANALMTSRAFVYLQEASYFNFAERPWCGKEWAAFRQRLNEHADDKPDARRPPLMFPVIWQTIAQLPEAVEEVQFSSDSLGVLYRQFGAYELKNRSEWGTNYAEFVTKLAEYIVEAANKDRLRAANNLAPFATFQNPWTPVGPPPTEPRKSSDRGPRYVDVIYAVAKRDRVKAFRKALDSYDAQDDPAFWRPFFPPTDSNVAEVAEVLILKRKQQPARIPFGNNLVTKIRESLNDGRIVVVVVDPWSLMLPECKSILEGYSQNNLWNSVIIVAWNGDAETRQAMQTLERTVQQVFFQVPEVRLRDRVQTSEEFEQQLRKAILEAESSIVKKNDLFRQVDGDGPRSAPSFSGV